MSIKAKETERRYKEGELFSIIDIHTLGLMLAYRRRSGQKAMYRLGINHFELELLLCFVGILRMLCRKNVNKPAIINRISGNNRYKKKLDGYWYGLHSKQFIGEIITKNGGSTFYLAPLGVKAVQLFEDEYKRLMTKLLTDEQKDTPNAVIFDYSKNSPTQLSDFVTLHLSHFAPPPPVKRMKKAA